jgi:two-component system NarL family sensor kinase
VLIEDDMAPKERRAHPAGRPPRLTPALARFVAGTLVAALVVVVGGFFALRSVTTKEAERNTREQVTTLGKLVESAGLTDGVLRGDRRSLAKLDDLVVGQVLSPSIVRVKVWSPGGRIVYSDEPAIIGRRFKLGDEERGLFREGGAEAEISDLSKPENEFERSEHKLLEAYTVIRTPDGRQVLFEIYERFGSVTSAAERLLKALAPPLLAGLVVLLAFQMPLAWSLARRLQRGHGERERLLTSAIEAQTQERRRIAADLHDGVVQELAGVAFGLAPLAEDAERRGAGEQASVLRDATSRLRQGVRGLRTMLVEIHPPNLESAGLEAALSDLLSPLESAGVATELHVHDGATAAAGSDALVYRVAREAVTNIRKHSGATSVRVDVSRPDPQITRLTVRDDGKGFGSDERERRGEGGHLGLTLLEDLVRQADGTLDVRSAPGEGTTVELEVPTR